MVLNSEYTIKTEKTKIQAMAIDSGGLTAHSVYNYCRQRKTKVIPIKGSYNVTNERFKVDIDYKVNQ